MTYDSGQAVIDSRADEIARYVEQVRAALGDLPAAVRADLLEDLPTHLSEVAAEDPTPLADRLGSPAEYAAELRAALDPTEVTGRRGDWFAGWTGRWEQLRGRLPRLDERLGPLLGYQRISEFGRLLVPAWWVLRGYLAAMFVVTVLDQQGQIGLIPRLGGSTLAGLVILAAAIAGSVWFARRTPQLGRWPRRVVFVASAFLVLVGIAGFAGIDAEQRWGWPTGTDYVSVNPYEGVADVYPVDQQGRLITGVTLLDQNGNPIHIGWAECYDEENWDVDGDAVASGIYPYCPENAPLWLDPPAATPMAGR
jgi:hypothetical protein